MKTTLPSDAAWDAEVHWSHRSPLTLLSKLLLSQCPLVTELSFRYRMLQNESSWFPTIHLSNICLPLGQMFLWGHRWTCLKSSQSFQCYNNENEIKRKSLSCVRLFATSIDYWVHGILQARILEWVAFPFSRGSSQPRDRTQVSCITGGFFTSWATREAHYDSKR